MFAQNYLPALLLREVLCFYVTQKVGMARAISSDIRLVSAIDARKRERARIAFQLDR